MIRRSTEAQHQQEDPIENERQRAHDAVFDHIGSAVGTGMDVLEGTGKVAAFGVGRTIHGIQHTLHAAFRGVMGRPYPKK